MEGSPSTANTAQASGSAGAGSSTSEAEPPPFTPEQLVWIDRMIVNRAGARPATSSAVDNQPPSSSSGKCLRGTLARVMGSSLDPCHPGARALPAGGRLPSSSVQAPGWRRGRVHGSCPAFRVTPNAAFQRTWPGWRVAGTRCDAQRLGCSMYRHNPVAGSSQPKAPPPLPRRSGAGCHQSTCTAGHPKANTTPTRQLGSRYRERPHPATG